MARPRLVDLLTVLCSLALLAPGCRGAGAPGSPEGREAVPEQDFVLAFLVAGPERASIPPERARELQGGHMENIRRLARERSLLLAGPFVEPRADPRLRGIFVLDVRRLSDARELVASDPAVEAGQLAAELHPWRSSSPLHALPDLYDELERERFAADPDASPFEGRKYVLAMARDGEEASAVLAPLFAEGRVLFHGRFGGDLAGTALYCLDEPDPEAARARLEAAAARAGIEPDAIAWELHPWFASHALTRLPARAAAARRGSLQVGGWVSGGVELR